MDDQVAFLEEFNRQVEMVNGRHALGVQSSGGWGGVGVGMGRFKRQSDEALDVLAELGFGDSGSDTDEDEETSSEDEEEQAYAQIRDYEGAERAVIPVQRRRHYRIRMRGSLGDGGKIRGRWGIQLYSFPFFFSFFRCLLLYLN